MKAAGLAVAAACVFSMAHGAGAATSEPPAGAAACSACHATSAKTETPVPQLVGRKPDDIVAAMQAYRSGGRSTTVMDRIAKGFSEDEIRAMADWLGAQRPGPSSNAD